MSTILITVDALRADHLGQYGYDRDTMPALDKLCEPGILFENAFANGPYTRISIPALHSSVRLAHTDLASLPTIASELRDEGVVTACVGTRTGFKSAEGTLHFDTYVTLGRDDYHEKSKQQQPLHIRLENKVVPAVSSAIQSFPRVSRLAKSVYNAVPFAGSGFSFKGYTSAAEVTDTTIDWLSEHSDEEFFLWIHYMEGHRPYGVHDETPRYTSSVSDERIRKLMKKAGTKPDEVTPEERELLVDLYDSDLSYCSTHIERLFSELRALNLWKETDIVFTSDHGEEFYDHGEYFHRNLPYDELLHVPLILRPSRSTEAREIRNQRELVDVAPTILAFHDIDPPAAFEGQHLLTGDSRDVISTGSQQHEPPVVAGRWDGYKYIDTPDETYLFDLDSEPRESRNLSTENPSLWQKYRDAIPDRYFSDEVKEQLREPDDDVDREQLEALGYLEIDE